MENNLSQQQTVTPNQIFEIIIRRKWWVIIPLCISLTAGLYISLKSVKIYEASTLILVQPQKVPEDFVRSVISSDIEQRLNTISHQILSRSNLEKIIDQFSLYSNESDMYLEDKVADIRKRIKVKIERTGRNRRGSGEAFSIRYKGSDPNKVMRISNTLASFFMDENLKVREAQAIGTSEFLESEVEKIKKKLEEREMILSQYRSKFIGGLPDELESNLRTLDRLQMQLTDKNSLLRETKNTLALMETQMAKESELTDEKFREDNQIIASAGRAMSDMTDNERQLLDTQKEYEDLLLKYTKKHPDVKKLEKTIKKLKESIKEEKVESGSDPDQGKKSERITDKQATKVIRQELNIKKIKNDIAQMQSEIIQIKKNMKIYQQRVEDTPKREQEMQSLQRDYANIRDIYNSLLDRKLEAELSVNMEKKQKGEQFRILDHARLPERPISPDVKKIFLLSVGAGLGFSVAIIFLFEFFDTTIRRDSQIEKELGLPILASIAPIQLENNRYKKTLSVICFGMTTCYALILLLFFAILNLKGIDRTTDILKMYING